MATLTDDNAVDGNSSKLIVQFTSGQYTRCGDVANTFEEEYLHTNYVMQLSGSGSSSEVLLTSPHSLFI